jgi:hypothetical protein
MMPLPPSSEQSNIAEGDIKILSIYSEDVGKYFLRKLVLIFVNVHGVISQLAGIFIASL